MKKNHIKFKCNFKASMCSYSKNPKRFQYKSLLLSRALVLFIVQVKMGLLTSDVDQYANILDEKVLCPEY